MGLFSLEYGEGQDGICFYEVVNWTFISVLRGIPSLSPSWGPSLEENEKKLFLSKDQNCSYNYIINNTENTCTRKKGKINKKSSKP